MQPTARQLLLRWTRSSPRTGGALRASPDSRMRRGSTQVGDPGFEDGVACGNRATEKQRRARRTGLPATRRPIPG